MKTKLFTIVLAFIYVNAFTQITVTDNDIIDVGDIVYQAIDTVPGTAITPGVAGANQTWDFSSLQVMDQDDIEFISPSGTPYASMHPTANICVEDDGEYIYLEKTSSGVSIIGFDAVPYQLLIAPLPLVYGNTLTIGPDVLMDSVMPNMFVPDSLAMLLTMGQAQTIDSINIKVTRDANFDVDAYGSVIIPMGTYDALRLKSEATTTTEYYVYCTDTLLGVNSGWFSATALMPNEVESEASYQWWTNNPAVKFILAEISVDSAGNVGKVNFSTSAPTAIAELDADKFNIYPIPTAEKLTIDAQINAVTNLELVDVSGKIILNKAFTQTTNLDLSQISSGIYYLNLSTNEGRLTKKIIVE